MIQILVMAALTAAGTAQTDQQETRRVGGDLDVVAERYVGADGEVLWRAGSSSIDTPLPEGYPAPTPPGAIEIKHYPEVRRAETGGSSGFGFWRLFRHIKRRDIAMTAPVEIDYGGLGTDGQGPDDSTMSFLYRYRDQGPEGDDGSVTVRDAAPVTVLSLGLQGRNSWRTVAGGLAVLEDWLASQDTWEPAGDPRALHYNDPAVPVSRRWMEVQLPVRRAGS